MNTGQIRAGVTMNTWNIEITDTFGGQANYDWVRRYTVVAKSVLGAVQKIAREYGTGWKVDYSDGDSARYNLTGNCICMFVHWVDPSEPEHHYQEAH